MAEIISVLQLAVPPAIEAIKGSCKFINNKLEKRKNRKRVPLDTDSQNLEDELQNALERLSSKVYIFGGFMQAAPDRQDQGPGVQQWFDQLKDALYHAEDLLDGYATDMAVQEMQEADNQEEQANASPLALPPVKTERSFLAKVRASTSTSKNSCVTQYSSNINSSQNDTVSQMKNAEPYIFANQIKIIIDKLEELENTRAGLGIKVVSDPKQNKLKLKWRETDHILDNCPIMGRDDESREIKQVLQIDDGSYLSNKNSKQITTMLASSMKLLFDKAKNILAQLGITNNKNREQQPKLSILPIIGMGGIGKTTLAKLLYNDPVVTSSFNQKVWVCVSDNFDERIIIKNTIRIMDSSQEIKESDTKAYVKNILLESVEGKSMFLVLDDIWNAEIGAWDSLLGTFGEACKVSKGITIIITTRLPDIRMAIPTCMEPVHLEGLKEKDTWQLVKFHAFRNYRKLPGYDDQETLEMIGKDIVLKLKGSPLAAKTIGKLLDSSHTAKHWRGIACKELHTLKQKEDDIIPILRLSYEYLPIHLKQCLIYFSLFPKDYKFRKMEMVRYWIAHNCIQHADDEDVEDVAIQYFELLVNRSFLECNDSEEFDDEFEIDTYNKASTYLMHDLIHDVVQSVSKFDCYWLYDDGSEKGFGNSKGVQRHASIYRKSNLDDLYGNVLPVAKLRTFISTSSFNSELISRMRCLRVLVLQGNSSSTGQRFKVDDCIGACKHLRVLVLKYVEMSQGLEFLGQLYNLQVLELFYCYAEIDDSILKLRIVSSLRALGSYGVSKYCVVKKKGLLIDELKHLNMLQGSLRLENLQLLTSKEEALQACLDKKSRLRELEFVWNDITAIEETQRHQVLEGLKPCKQLRKIELSNYMGGQLPTWMSDIWLEVLEEISLDYCYEIKTIPSGLGKMPALKKLHMRGLRCLKEIKWHREDLICWDEYIILFPALETLLLRDLPECVGWWIMEEAGPRQQNKIQTTNKKFPHLTELSIMNCPKLKCFPLLTDKVTVTSSLRTLEIIGLLNMDDELLSDFLFKGLTSLEKLLICNCPNLKSLPPVMSSNGSGLLSLQDFQLSYCPSLSSLPDLRPLPALRFLKIDSCPNLKDMHKDGDPPPAQTSSLRMLEIKGLDSMDDELLSDFLFKGLEKLDIRDCPKLTSFLHIPEKMTSLREMLIYRCDNLTYCCCPPSLTSLEISGCAGMTSLCIGSPDSSVGSLKIHNCPNLGKEHNNTSTCVEDLCIRQCSEEQLARLLSHTIHPAELKTLVISSCFDIESFSDLRLSTALLRLTSLVSLEINLCLRLESLPSVMSSSGSGLLSLQQIELIDCRMLSSLPDLRPLTALRRLKIKNCPMLQDKYKERKDSAGNNVNPDVQIICTDLRPLTRLRRLTLLDRPILKDKYKERKDYAGNNVNTHLDEICNIPDVQIRSYTGT